MDSKDIQRIRDYVAKAPEYVEYKTVGRPYMTHEELDDDCKNFYYAARTDLPLLLDRVEELAAELEREKAWKEEDPRMLREQIRVADVAFNHLHAEAKQLRTRNEQLEADCGVMRGLLGRVFADLTYLCKPDQRPTDDMLEMLADIECALQSDAGKALLGDKARLDWLTEEGFSHTAFDRLTSLANQHSLTGHQVRQLIDAAMAQASRPDKEGEAQL